MSSEAESSNPADGGSTPPATVGALPPGASSFLPALTAALADRAAEMVYPCIRDLLAHGLDLTRFAPGETTPNRQAVTAFLAAWSRHAGLTESETGGWLIDYSTSVLARLSKRTAAAIRHSTKSHIRYFYRSGVPFICGCEANPCKAGDCSTCPVLPDMQAKLLAKAEEALKPRTYQPPVPTVVLSVKAAHREQFREAMRLAAEHVRNGMKARHITNLLNEAGFKTRTGRKWTEGMLGRELAKWPASSEPAPEQTPGGGTRSDAGTDGA